MYDDDTEYLFALNEAINLVDYEEPFIDPDDWPVNGFGGLIRS